MFELFPNAHQPASGKPGSSAGPASWEEVRLGARRGIIRGSSEFLALALREEHSRVARTVRPPDRPGKKGERDFRSGSGVPRSVPGIFEDPIGCR